MSDDARVKPAPPRWAVLGLAKDPEAMSPEEREAAQLVLLESWLWRLRLRAAKYTPAGNWKATASTAAAPVPPRICRDCRQPFARTGSARLCEACWTTVRQRVAARMRACAVSTIDQRLQAQADAIDRALAGKVPA